ncbi:zinc-ribbon domain-containing protein [Succinivibrio dextrinosolvens]|uniref:zinc ribbon domain-containing protein n=1 Tax=Succinivibrio dextrinosolvens TaxID=83771 RepID=UPI0008E9742F|nr:zinc ribbon domain-containing protein [Succinivibrio dextrinosolvens]SFS36176.1 zinc-ribbon domain-containing protein [Succinivibrio dextrinosolvens]
MICSKCGKEIPNHSDLCPECGSKIETHKAEKGSNDKKYKQVSSNIYLCKDGFYRWIYELNMLKNPTILITLTKVFLLTVFIVFLMIFLIQLFDNGFDFDDFITLVLVHSAIFVGLMFIGVIAYFIVAWLHGFKYVVIFEMNDELINHIQAPHQFKKAQVLGAIATSVGIMTKNLSTIGLGQIVSSSQSLTSKFSSIRKIIINKKLHVIRLNHLLTRNHVYFENEDDFEFVMSFIKSHCSNASIVE